MEADWEIERTTRVSISEKEDEVEADFQTHRLREISQTSGAINKTKGEWVLSEEKRRKEEKGGFLEVTE